MSLSLKEQAFLFYRDRVGIGRWACRACASDHVKSNQFAAQIRDLKAEGHKVSTVNTGTCDICNEYSSKTLDSLASLDKDESRVRADFDGTFFREYRRRNPEQTCSICTSTASIEIDHRNPANSTHRYTLDDLESGKAAHDLQYLCRSCNAKKREHCTKRCKQANIPVEQMRRGNFYDLSVFAMGNAAYDPVLDCLGCPYHEPENTKQLIRIAVAELQKSDRMIFNASIELLIQQLAEIRGDTFSKNEMYAMIRELKLKHFNAHWKRITGEKVVGGTE